MSEFLSSVKADLTDRRLLPVVVLVGLALTAALAYAVLGGGSSAAVPPATLSRGATSPPGLPISQVTPEKAVAETTGGVSEQRNGAVRNPFTPLPQPKAKAASTAASGKAAAASSGASSSSTGSSPSGSAGSSGSSSGSGGSTPATPTPAKPSTPATPAKPKTVYHVAALFGAVPAGTPPQTAQLTPYESLKLLTPLPSAKQPLIIFRGVTVGGKSATFTLVSEAILHGPGACLPSAARCEAIDLHPGQAEQLEYLSATGQALAYELRIVSIVSSKASSAALKSIYRGESKAGRRLLGHGGLVAIPGLRYSSAPGVLVFATHHAFAARRRHGR